MNKKNLSPFISVIIPSYNVENYLAEACDSVLEQTYDNWEALIIDDGSTDKTGIIAKKYCQKNSRFKYFYKENAGLSAARKTGIDNAAGEFIQFLDADDILLPERFEILIKEYSKSEKGIILYTDFWVGLNDHVNKDRVASSRPIGLNRDLDFNDMYFWWHQKFLFVPACVLLRKEHLLNTEYDSSLRAVEDWDLYLSLSSRGLKFRAINKKLVVYRDNPEGLSKNHNLIRKNFYFVLNKWKDTTAFSSKKYYQKCGIEYSNQLFKFIFNKKVMLRFPMLIKRTSIIKSFLDRIKTINFTALYLSKRLYKLFTKQLKKYKF